MGEILCEWCQVNIVGWRPGMRFCTTRCRQAAHRLRRLGPGAIAVNGAALRFAYVDPPYIGTAKKYYEGEDSYRGEVDHVALISLLEMRRNGIPPHPQVLHQFSHLAMGEGPLAGWALSASAKSLRMLLPLCPEGARVCPWVKPIGVPRASYGPHNTWEPLIVVGGRRLRGGCRDWLRAAPARKEGTLPGRKPIAFCAFLFQQLGLQPDDVIEDWFPGTRIVSRSWDEMSRLRAPANGDAASVVSADDAA